MNTITAYTGTVEKGKFIPDSPRDFAKEFLRRNGRRVVVSVKEWRKNRSSAQNRFWWAVVVPLFADAMGCTPEEAHEALKAEINCELFEVGERVIRLPKSTANLNTTEFKNLVEKAQRLAAEMFPGLYIPDPESAQADAMMDEKAK